MNRSSKPLDSELSRGVEGIGSESPGRHGVASALLLVEAPATVVAVDG